MKNPVNWFELPAENIERAIKFYRDVFGYDMSAQNFGGLTMAFFPMDPKLPGAGGALVQHEMYKPSYKGTMIYFSVDNIEGVLQKVSNYGGSVINEKSSIGEFGFVAHFEDPEGNRVALHADN